jgi:hypothetical protein
LEKIWYLDFCVMNVGSSRYSSEKLGWLLKTFRCTSNQTKLLKTLWEELVWCSNERLRDMCPGLGEWVVVLYISCAEWTV